MKDGSFSVSQQLPFRMKSFSEPGETCTYFKANFNIFSHTHLFPTRRDKVTGEWRRLHNEELNDLYALPNIVPVIKSRRIRWAGHVVRMGEERGCIGSWWGNRRERDHWGDLGVDGWIIY